jgi:hypothetical protein
MLRHALTLASITVLVPLSAGCAASAPRAPRSAAAARVAPAKAAPARALAAKPADKAAALAREAAAEKLAQAEIAAEAEQKPGPIAVARKLGDFHVYQYGGTFAKQPVTLTEQVVAREGDVLVVDFVLEEGDRMSAIRVRMKDDNQVVAVARITAEGEVPTALAEYDALMQKTQFVPDSNDQALGTDHTSCLVGDEQVECDVTTYRVTYGSKQAKLTITRSSRVPGRDIGGDVVAENGKVLYSARLVERGNEPPVVEALAKLDRFVPSEP